jgi:hypothetical protein
VIYFLEVIDDRLPASQLIVCSDLESEVRLRVRNGLGGQAERVKKEDQEEGKGSRNAHVSTPFFSRGYP